MFYVPPFFQEDARAVPVLESCESGATRLAEAGASDSVTVLSSLAGGEQACYRVRVMRGGVAVVGYVIGATLPAIADFEVEHRKKMQAALQAAIPRPVAPKAASAAKDDAPPLPLQKFANFEARDASGKRFSLGSLNRKAILVTFWSPGSKQSVERMKAIVPVYEEWNLRGLAAVGISMGTNPGRILGALDDTGIAWPQIPDGAALAGAYKVNPNEGITMVLDSDRNIVVATADPRVAAAAARKLLAR